MGINIKQVKRSVDLKAPIKIIEIEPTGEIEINENGIHNIKDFATANVQVEGIKPTGTLNITNNGEYDVIEYAKAKVEVDKGIQPTGTIDIKTNGKHNVSNYAEANVNVETKEPTGTLDITANGVYDVKDYAKASVVVSSGGNVDASVKALIEGTITELIDYEITTVKKYGLGYSENLTKVALPNVTTIADSAFSYAGVVEVNLPNCETGGASSFYKCEQLLKVNLPKLKKVEQSMFAYNAVLEELDFLSVNTIGAQAFYYSKNMAKLILRSPVVVHLLNTSAFNSSGIGTSKGNIYVPDELVEEYKVANNWSKYATQIKPLSELEG